MMRRGMHLEIVAVRDCVRFLKLEISITAQDWNFDLRFALFTLRLKCRRANDVVTSPVLINIGMCVMCDKRFGSWLSERPFYLITLNVRKEER